MRDSRWLLCALAVGLGLPACDSSDDETGETAAQTDGGGGTEDSGDAGASDSDDSDDAGGSDASASSTTGDDSDAGSDSDATTATTTGDPSTSGEATTAEPTTGDETTGDETTGDTGSQLPPTDLPGIEAWLEAGEYLGWEAESGPHASTGPHFGTVRTFFNDALFESFENSQATHPIGVASVKELYGQTNDVLGWAIMAKYPEDGGDWYWYEIYNDQILADGVGLGVCENCHGDGVDQVLTPWPLQ